jgi:hypothetical protein
MAVVRVAGGAMAGGVGAAGVGVVLVGAGVLAVGSVAAAVSGGQARVVGLVVVAGVSSHFASIRMGRTSEV